jgi:phage terminase large subunit
LLAPARYKGAFGGRGSGKSHFFGELLVETCQAERGTLAVCIREAQRTLAQSSKRLIESKIAALGLGHGFRFFNDKIETPGDGLVIFRGMHHQGRLSALPAEISLGMATYLVLAEVHRGR